MLTKSPQTNRESRSILPHAAFSGFASRYREPKASEGFVDIIKTDFLVRFHFRETTHARSGLEARQHKSMRSLSCTCANRDV
jgi:hypothetical protein